MLEAGLKLKVNSKLREFNSIKIPVSTLISSEKYEEGDRLYLLSKQLLIHVESISGEARLASFRITYPSGKEVSLSNLSQGSRSNFEFQNNTYMFDVGAINYIHDTSAEIKNVYITISRASI